VAKSKSIPLTEPLVGHNGPISEVVFREPTFADLMDLGDPVDIVRTSDGHFVRTVNWPAVGEYCTRCADNGAGILLSNLNLKDSLAASEAVLSFFTEARTTNSSTANSPASSPST
jgi:hypothetical protein